MDRIIPKETLRRENRIKMIKLGGILGAVVIAVGVGLTFLSPTIDSKDITIGKVDTGSIDVSVTGSGRVVPAIEEMIVTPINSRILEVYKRGGDSVDVGTPILRLDLATMETEYGKMKDQLEMRRYEVEQLRAHSQSRISDLEMKIKVGDMQVSRKSVELRNEQYLDSIGAGTQDKVREAELSYNVSRLEQEQLRRQLANSRSVASAELNVKILEMRMYEKSLNELSRLLSDAQIGSPRKGILTFVNTQIGVQVAAGTQVAIVSDLSRFKVDADIADAYVDQVRPGARAVVKIGKEELPGTVSSVTPMSKNGTISFSVALRDDSSPLLRSGLKADVHILTAVRDDVVRMPNGSFYSGPAEYKLFVRDGNTLVKRTVRLGESNYNYVEVISGLLPGDEVVVSNMKTYENDTKLKLK